jgi:glycosyltransferase involved in cell wall biosynthesis
VRRDGLHLSVSDVRVAALAHYAIPYRNAGGETVLHQLLRALVEAGHHVEMWTTDCKEAPPKNEYEGVQLRSTNRHPLVAVQHIIRSQPDVVITQFHRAQLILRRAKATSKTVYIAHNDMIVTHMRPLSMHPDLVIVNSDWARESLLSRRMPLPENTLTIHPPLGEHHRVESTGESITMVNLNEHKGSHVFYEMARRFPNQHFIGVLGSHGKQIVKSLPNVEILDNRPDLRPVWERTKVVLMPSVYESFGLIAAEAGLSGIPTITHPTPGLLESRGDAGIHADRDDLDAWEYHVDLLLHDDSVYADASAASRKQSEMLLAETKHNLDLWTKSVEGLVNSA